MNFNKFTQTFRYRIELVAFISVARVRPRTSKGTTDLLLPQTSVRCTRIVPLRSWLSIGIEIAS